MFSVLAILIYAAAIAVPAWLLYHFGSGGWYWHVLAVLAAVALGLVPLPAALDRPLYELMVGFVFVFLMVWGLGGMFAIRLHHAKHAKNSYQL